jgi:dolichyl-phosphate-mannose--protein O-mannosyl transferase
MPTKLHRFVERYYTFLLIVILGFAFLTRFARLSYPSTYYFDERYHAVTARLMLHNNLMAFEWWHPPFEATSLDATTAIDWLHPPFAKYMQAFSMLLFGENSFGWRFSSAVVGVLVIYLTALLAEKLFKNKPIAILAAFLASLDGLLLVQSRIAMNDIHVTFFILLSFYLYLIALEKTRRTSLAAAWLPWLKVGGALGLAVATKWTGLFAVGIVAVSETSRAIWYYSHTKHKPSLKLQLTSALRWVFCFFLVPSLMYVASYAQMFIQGKDLTHFWQLHREIWAYQTQYKASHTYQSKPLQWWLNDRPVWMFVSREQEGFIENIYAFGNPILLWLGVVVTCITAVWIFNRRKKTNEDIRLLWLWLSYLFLWVPWQFAPRMMFFYHYTPAVPLMCILIAFWLFSFWHSTKISSQIKTLLIFAVLGFCVLFFVLWYPHWTAISVPTWWADSLYFWRASWK